MTTTTPAVNDIAASEWGYWGPWLPEDDAMCAANSNDIDSSNPVAVAAYCKAVRGFRADELTDLLGGDRVKSWAAVAARVSLKQLRDDAIETCDYRFARRVSRAIAALARRRALL